MKLMDSMQSKCWMDKNPTPMTPLKRVRTLEQNGSLMAYTSFFFKLEVGKKFS